MDLKSAKHVRELFMNAIENLRRPFKKKAKNVLSSSITMQDDINITQLVRLDKILQQFPEAELENYRDLLENIGIDISSKSRIGSYYQVDNLILETISKQTGIEIMPLEEALDYYGKEILEYYWKALDVAKDKFTALAELYGKGGYVIRVKKGMKVQQPIQTCLLVFSDNILQAPHNIIILEKGSELHVITGCAVMREVIALHAGISEFYIEENAKLTFTMIHSWNEKMHVRPRTGVIVKEGGQYISHYINIMPVRSLQTYPTIRLTGENARAYASSILIVKKKSKIDLGNEIIFEAPKTSGEIISRTIAKDEAKSIVRGRLVGKAPNIKGHLECMGLLLSNTASIKAIPELEAQHTDVDLTHEASIGKLAEEKIIYLMARGFTENEATSLLVRGFMSVELKDLPESLQKIIEATIERMAKTL